MYVSVVSHMLLLNMMKYILTKYKVHKSMYPPMVPMGSRYLPTKPKYLLKYCTYLPTYPLCCSLCWYISTYLCCWIPMEPRNFLTPSRPQPATAGESVACALFVLTCSGTYTNTHLYKHLGRYICCLKDHRRKKTSRVHS